MNKAILELCTECLQIFVEHTIEGSVVDAVTLLTDKKYDLIEDGDTLGSMMVGYCLARGYCLDEIDQGASSMEDVIDNLIKQYQEV